MSLFSGSSVRQRVTKEVDGAISDLEKIEHALALGSAHSYWALIKHCIAPKLDYLQAAFGLTAEELRARVLKRPA